MSLVVWLPMTKDLRQQGLSDRSITNSGVTFDLNGKLGGCYVLDGTDDAIGIGNLSTLVETDFSFACWFYHDDTWSSKSWETIFGGPSGFELQTKNSSTNSPCIYLYSWGKGTFTYDLSTWNHLVMTRNSSETKVYLNGELKLTGTAGSIPSGDYFIGSWKNSTSQNFKGKVCDVRIYDHCLSPMEVKRISQGLVLHYNLSDGTAESTTNIITTEDCLSSTCYNGATSKYGYGTTTDMYKTVTTFDGKKGTKVYMGTSGKNTFPYVYINNMYTSDGGSYPLDRTLSFDYYSTISTSIRPYKLGSGSGTATYRVQNASTGISTGTGTDAVMIPVKSNMWNHIEITFHNTTTDSAQWGYIQNYPSHTSDTSNFWFFANMQLENKDHATAYAGVGGTRTSTIIYDTSGYCNNGAINNDLIISTDTPKYKLSVKFDGTNSATTSPIFDSTTRHSELTIATWIKRTSDDANYHYYLSSSGVSAGIRSYNSVNNYYLISWNHATDSSSSVNSWVNTVMPLNTWVHSVWTFSHGIMKHYINGELKGTSDRSATGTYILGDICSIIGTGYSTSSNWEGGLSDLRIYTTALSADDVKSLYQNSAYIDSSGNVYGTIHEV